eukprot:scpid65350/ scgid30640/ 
MDQSPLNNVVTTELQKRYPLADVDFPTIDYTYQEMLNWPVRLDGRGWPQHTCFDSDSLHHVFLLMTVDILPSCVDDAGSKRLSVLVRYNPFCDHLKDASVVAVHDIFAYGGAFAQVMRDSADVRCITVQKVNNLLCRGGPPRFSVATHRADEESSSRCFEFVELHGMLTGVTVRLWFKHSVTGQFCVFPSEWHGPDRAHFTSLLVVDVWNQKIVAAFTTDGQCLLPGKPLSEWSIADEDISRDRVVHFDHANTATFSPDGCLLAVWQQGPHSTLRIMDCQLACELPLSQNLPQPTLSSAPQFQFAGTAAFDPSSVGADGRASRIAYTSKSGGGEASHTRFAADHTISVCSLTDGELVWHYHHPHCIDQLCYDRYGTVLAATVMVALNGANDRWEVAIFNPTSGDCVSRIATPPGMYQLYCSPLGTCVLLYNFLQATRIINEMPVCEAITSSFPTLKQLVRACIHKRLRSQAAISQLCLPPILKTYLNCSLPIATK